MPQTDKAGPRPGLTPHVILHAYSVGYFPMADADGDVVFCHFEERGIVPLDYRFTVRRSLRQRLKKRDYHVTFDAATREVLQQCSRQQTAAREEVWLSQELIEHFMTLASAGIVHSVEVWRDDPDEPEGKRLIGGLYGLALGGAFCGESMFSLEPYASQIALVHLVDHLRARGFTLLDAQMASEHLMQFGLQACTQDEYMLLFNAASSQRVHF